MSLIFRDLIEKLRKLSINANIHPYNTRLDGYFTANELKTIAEVMEEFEKIGDLDTIEKIKEEAFNT